jgi:hydrogenase maturation protease
MPRVLVLGIGNPLRGDDALGWHAARQLARLYGANAETRFLEDNRWVSADASVEIMTCQQMTMDLVEPVHEADQVIFIDATVQGEPGSLTCEPVTPEAPQNLISHQFDAPTLLAAVQALYGVCPKAVVLSVTASTFDYSEELSPAVAARLPELVRCVRSMVEAKPGGA